MWFSCLLPVAPVNTLPSDINVYMYVPRALKRIYSISRVTTFLDKKFVAITYGVTLVEPECLLSCCSEPVTGLSPQTASHPVLVAPF